MMYRVTLPWPYKACWPNDRPPHWAVQRRVTSKYRKDCALAAMAAGWRRWTADSLHMRVTFCPRSRGPIPDRDNRIAAFKAAQDGLSDVLGINDRILEPAFDLGPRCRDGAVIVEVWQDAPPQEGMP